MKKHLIKHTNGRKISTLSAAEPGSPNLSQLGYYRQAIALQCMGRHAEALAAYASALAHDGKSQQLLQALVEAALKSPLQHVLEPLLEQVDGLEISGKAFATVALIGQELITLKETQAAITVLESALELGTDNLPIKGSVYSALSSSYWGLGNVKRAIHYMQQDLLIVEDLKDTKGICRVHGNLGNAYYAQDLFVESKHHYNKQLEVATQLDDVKQAAKALTDLGHVHTSTRHFEEALKCHKKAALLYKESNNKLMEGKELSHVGTVYLLMGHYEEAIQLQRQYVELCYDTNNSNEICNALVTLGNLYQNVHKYSDAVKIFDEMLIRSEITKDIELQSKALSGLGHAYRMLNNSENALKYHNQQLQLAISSNDRQLECLAQANLGITHQHKGDSKKALEFHEAYLMLCRKLNDRDGECRAYGNIGNTYNSLKEFEKAIKYLQLGLSLAREINERHSEASLHGSLAVSYLSIQLTEEALRHYEEHLSIAKELKDLRLEAAAECNLGKFYCVQEDYIESIKHYENYLSIADKLSDRQERCQATYKLAYCYFKVKNYDEAIVHYEDNIKLSYELDNRDQLALSYCNLGLAYLEIKEYEKSIRCQKMFLANAKEKKLIADICCALHNLGKSYICMGDRDEGLSYFNEQVKTAEKSGSDSLKGKCYHDLANVLRDNNQIDDAIVNIENEILIRQKYLDNGRELYYTALFTLAQLYEIQEKYSLAYKSYCDIFQISKSYGDVDACANVSKNMGKTQMKLKKYEKAILAFRLQLECSETNEDTAEAHRDIAQCFLHLNKFQDALSHFLLYADKAVETDSIEQKNDSFKKISSVYETLGQHKEQLLYSEKRLAIFDSLSNIEKCVTFNDVANAHVQLENHDSAINYYNELLNLSTEFDIKESQQHAYFGFGEIKRRNREWDSSVEMFEKAADIAKLLNDFKGVGDCLLLIGQAYTRTGHYEKALNCFEEALHIANEHQLTILKVKAFANLGKINHLLLNPTDSCHYLDLSAKYSEYLNDNTSETIKAFTRLGLKLYFEKQFDAAAESFRRAVHLIPDMKTSDEDAVLYVKASLQLLQKILININKPIEALFFADKANRFNSDIVFSKVDVKFISPDIDFDLFCKQINNFDSIVCYHSIVIGQLFSWILLPKHGFVKFWKERIAEKFTDNNLASLDLDDLIERSLIEVNNKIDISIKDIRKSLDVEQHENSFLTRKVSTSINIEILDKNQNPKSKIGQPYMHSQEKIEEINDNEDLVFQCKRPEPIEKVSRKHQSWSSSNGNLSEIYSLYMKQTIDFLKSDSIQTTYRSLTRNLTLIYPKELILLPVTLFADKNEYISKSFNISMSLSLPLLIAQHHQQHYQHNKLIEASDIFVFGAQMNCYDEIADISHLFDCSPYFGKHVTREQVTDHLCKSMVVHFATDIAWQTPVLRFPTKDIDSDFCATSESDPEIENLEPITGHTLSVESCIDAKDILEKNLIAKLVTVGIGPATNQTDPICYDGLHVLVTSFLSSGCQSLLTSLWPTSEHVRKFFLKTFYEKFNKCETARQAYNETISSMQSTKEFSHPSSWSGFVLFGGDSKIQRKTFTFTDGLMDFMENPSRDCIKLLVHLTEKARQRLGNEGHTSLYISEASIIKKIGPDSRINWKPILLSMGFRFERAHNGIPDAVFFPGAEHDAALKRGSNVLYALLGLSQNGLKAISDLRNSDMISSVLINLFQEVLYYFKQDMSNVQITIPLDSWKTPGCHELLSSLGFDVLGLGKEQVKLRSGKHDTKRTLQCAVQVLKEIFQASTPKNKKAVENRKALTQMIEKDDILKSMINLKRAKSENYPSRELRDELKNEDDNNNNFVNSSMGLFTAKEAISDWKDSPGVYRRIFSYPTADHVKSEHSIRSNSFSSSDMSSNSSRSGSDKSYLSIEQVDGNLTSDSQTMPSDYRELRRASEPANIMTAPLSPDIIDEHEIKTFALMFKEHIDKKRDSQRREDFTRTYITAHYVNATLASEASTESRRRGFSANDVFKLKDTNPALHSSFPSCDRKRDSPKVRNNFSSSIKSKQKQPPEWKHYEINNDYFDKEAKIDSIDIKESLQIDTSTLDKQEKNSVFRTLSSKLENGRRKSTEMNLEDSDKKRGGLLSKLFKMKKRHSFGNLLDLDMKEEMEKHKEFQKYNSKRGSEDDLQPYVNIHEQNDYKMQMHFC